LFFRKLFHRFGKEKEVEQFYRLPERQNFNFCYVNNIKYYMINCVESLFTDKNSIKMFVDNKIFVIHPADEFCTPSTKDIVSNNVNQSVIDYIKNLYPKQKFLLLFFEQLNKLNLIDENFYLKDFPNIHVTDLSMFLNNKFFKDKNKIDVKFVKMCKWFQANKIRFPKSSVKNPWAQKYLC